MSRPRIMGPRIVAYVRAHPGAASSQIAAALGIGLHRQCQELSRCVARGLLYRAGPRTHYRYFDDSAQADAAHGTLVAAHAARISASKERENAARRVSTCRTERSARALPTSTRPTKPPPAEFTGPVIVPPHVVIQRIPTRLLPHETYGAGDRVITADYMDRRQAART